MGKKDIRLKASNVDRRDFLKMFGLTLGGVAISNIHFPSKHDVNLIHSAKPKLSKLPAVGLLVPRSSLYPNLGNNIAAGLKLCMDEVDLNNNYNPDKLQIVEIGPRPIEAIENVKSLIAKNKVDIIVGIINPSIAVELHEILEKNRTFLILIESGANITRFNEYSPYIFHNNLGYWKSSLAAGDWAVRNIGKKVFIASSFYESGYDALYAFNLGVEKAGGKIIQTYISHIPPNRMEMNYLLNAIENAKPDFVFASYSGKEAVEFAKAFSTSFSVNRIPLVGSSVLAENLNQDNHSSLLPGMISCSSWSSNLNSSKNKSFKKAFIKMTSREADSFAVLGYDTGRLIIEAAKAAGSKLKNVIKVRNALRNARINSPRGILYMDSIIHTIQSPVYLQEIRVNTNSFNNFVKDELKPIAENFHPLTALRKETRTGWLNAYLNV